MQSYDPSRAWWNARKPQDFCIPEHVITNLQFMLEHEQEDPDRFGPAIEALSQRWGT